MKCEVCEIEFESTRGTAKYCSPKCRKLAFHKKTISVPNGELAFQKPSVPELAFQFHTKNKRTDTGFHEDDQGKPIIREAIYWYDVPLGAVPIIQEGWPKMPDFMNGRQYFLWWKNEFKTENDKPLILNPYPSYQKLEYVRASEESRRWGA